MEEKDDLALINNKIRKTEEDGLTNIIKYFNRIHDKLFAFNNILIAGFFTLSKIDNSISVKTILIPIANLIILIYIEYRMMETSRYQARVSNKTRKEIKKQGKNTNNTNLYSLFTIFTTLLVTISFLYYLIFSN